MVSSSRFIWNDELPVTLHPNRNFCVKFRSTKSPQRTKTFRIVQSGLSSEVPSPRLVAIQDYTIQSVLLFAHILYILNFYVRIVFYKLKKYKFLCEGTWHPKIRFHGAGAKSMLKYGLGLILILYLKDSRIYSFIS